MPSNPSRIRSTLGLAKTAAVALSFRFVAMGLILLSNWLLTQLTSTKGFGTYSYLLAWTNVLAIPGSLGLNKLTVREVAIYRTQAAWGYLRGFLQWTDRRILVTSTGIALIAGGCSWLYHLQRPFPNQWGFWLALVSLPLLTLKSQKLAAINGCQHTLLSLLPETFLEPVILTLLICSWYLLNPQPLTPVQAIGCYVVMNAITLGLTNRLFQQTLSKTVPSLAATPQFDSHLWMKSALPLMLLEGIQILNVRASVLILGALKGAEIVGIYVIAQRWSQLVSFMLTTLNTVLAPRFARYYAQNRLPEIRNIYLFSSRLMMAFALLVAGVLVVYREQILSWFGPQFIQGSQVLMILSLGQVVNAATGSVGVLLNMTGNEGYTTLSATLGAILNVVGNLLLVPILGMEGSAIATTTSLVCSNLLKLYWVHQKLNLNLTTLTQLRPDDKTSDRA
jgi:O-antigen/teichoic acid export membrane protein